MYNDDIMRTPVDEDDLWRVLREQFEFVRHVLWELPVETREEALQNDFHKREDGSISRAGMAVIRYRGSGDELDQRDHYLALGRELFTYIESAIDKQVLTPELVQQWGKIMFCHGYIASYVFDDTDDLESYRNRLKGAQASDRTPQRVFLARLLLWFMDERKLTRQRAEAAAARAIWHYIDAASAERPSNRNEIDWFETLTHKTKNRDLIVSSMNQKNMSETMLRELAAGDIAGLPSIALLVDVPDRNFS